MVNRVTWKIALSLVLVCQLFHFPARAATDNLEEAKHLYAAGDFDDAKESLIIELQKSPNNAAARYMLGNTYLELDEKEHAIGQYTAAVQLNPNSQAGKFSHDALIRLSAQAQAAVSQSTSSSHAVRPDYTPAHSGASLRSSMTTPGEQSSLVKPPVENSTQSIGVDPAISSTTSQGTLRNSEFSQECDAKVNRILQEQDKVIKALAIERDGKIAENNSQKFLNSYGRYDPRADNSALQREFSQRRDELQAVSARRCDEIRAYYRSKEDAMQDTISAVQDNLSKASGKRAIKMVPLGTNIFTRNYQTTGETSGAPIPVRAAPAKLLPQVGSDANSQGANK